MNTVRRTKHFIAGILMLLMVAAAAAPTAAKASCRESGRTVSVLILGNSLSKRIKNPLRTMFCDAGYRAEVRSITPSGATLGDHLASTRTRAMLRSGSWDYVVLQEQSIGIFGERIEHARALDQLAAENGAQTLLLMTWLNRGRVASAYGKLLGEPDGDFGYVAAACSIGTRVAPVGWAFRQIVLDGSPLNLWGPDDHHPSKLGQLLAAKVLASMILSDFTGGPGALPALDVTDADDAYLDSVAQEVLENAPYGWDFRAP